MNVNTWLYDVPQIHLRHYKLAVIDCLCVPGTDVEDPAPLALGAGSLSEKEIGSGRLESTSTSFRSFTLFEWTARTSGPYNNLCHFFHRFFHRKLIFLWLNCQLKLADNFRLTEISFFYRQLTASRPLSVILIANFSPINLLMAD